jgi:hypothetical protein
MSEPDFLSTSRIGILGLGLMGGSLALALHGRCQENPVPGGLLGCIRVLLQWKSGLAQHEIYPIYLGSTASLRPDFRNSDLLKLFFIL